jgi:hypothetical protein
VIVHKSALAKLPFSRPSVTYEDGRVVTLEQYALEQKQLLEQFEPVKTKNAFELTAQKAFFVSNLTIQL